MKAEEQAAFVRAYDNHVGEVDVEHVSKFVKDYFNGSIMERHWADTSILDSLGMWMEATKWKMEQGAKQ
jgi:hypothetical protein